MTVRSSVNYRPSTNQQNVINQTDNSVNHGLQIINPVINRSCQEYELDK